MPVRSKGRGCFQWGHHGKVYCGPGARQKAERQGRAAYAHGYQGHETHEAASRRHRPTPELLYRGTQRYVTSGVRGATSWTDSLPVAMIWSAVPGDAWASSRERRVTHLIETSTVHAAKLTLRQPLVIEWMSSSIGDVMRALSFGEPGGITGDEVLRIFNYMHNRMIGKAQGGEFKYIVYDEDGDEVDPNERDFTLDINDSLIRDVRGEFDYAHSAEDQFAIADRIAADGYIYWDSKTVQTVLRRLGFDGVIYPDVFQGCEYAARDLFGKDVSCEDMIGVAQDMDINGDEVFTHLTYRPLDEGAAVPVWNELTTTLLPELPRWLRG